MWVSDYLAVVRGEVEPRAIHCASQEDWAIDDPELPGLRSALWSFYHPQRFPARVLAQYRRAVALEAAEEIWRSAKRGPRTASRVPGRPRPDASSTARPADRPAARNQPPAPRPARRVKRVRRRRSTGRPSTHP
jgi:hypothetical protein